MPPARPAAVNGGSQPKRDHRSSPSSTEIARLAGVSQATVSRVLSGYRHVSDETRRRVLAVIEATGYVPNVLARGLVTSRTGAIGLVVSNITNQFYPELIEAICGIAAEHNLSVILGNAQQDSVRQRDYLRLLVEQRVEGIIVTSAMMKSPYIAELIRRRYPIVLVNRLLPGVLGDSVAIDNFDGARQAVRHFQALGHTRIAYVRGLAGTSTSHDRERGYKTAFRDADLPIDHRLILAGDFTPTSARRAAAQVVHLSDRPTAALGADDGTALGFIDGLIDLGLSVPQDCAVIGFDDIRDASHQLIGLSSVRQPVVRMAKLAMALLLDRINGVGPMEPQRVVLPAELIVRRTCGANPAWPSEPSKHVDLPWQTATVLAS